MSQVYADLPTQLFHDWINAEKKALEWKLKFAKTVVRIPKNRKNLDEWLTEIEVEIDELARARNATEQLIKLV